MICALALVLASPAIYAQKTNKELKKDLKTKVQKDMRKEAKKLGKEGWRVMPGKLPLDRQLQDSRYAELDTNQEGEKRFFTGNHQAVGGNYTAAKQIADDRARLELAQSIYGVIAQKIESQVASKDFGDGDIETIDQFVSAHKSIISAQLQGVTHTLEMYRQNKNGQYEVRVMVKTDAEKALKLAKAGLRNELQNKSAKLAQDLDRILPY